MESSGADNSKESKKRGREEAVATLTTTTGNTLNQNNDVDDDDDVVLERENSAWDLLGERFQKAATDGRYVDLSEEKDGGQLDASDAAKSFAGLKKPVDPSTIVHHSESTSNNNNHTVDDPLLAELGSLVTNLVTKLKATREKLLNPTSNPRPKALRGQIKQINQLSKRLQKFVNRNSEAVMNSDVAVRRVEAMNLLVCKANILITNYNSR